MNLNKMEDTEPTDVFTLPNRPVSMRSHLPLPERMFYCAMKFDTSARICYKISTKDFTHLYISN